MFLGSGSSSVSSYVAPLFHVNTSIVLVNMNRPTFAARAAVKTGDREAARRHYAALAEVWKDADPSLPDLAEVRTYLSGVPAR